MANGNLARFAAGAETVVRAKNSCHSFPEATRRRPLRRTLPDQVRGTGSPESAGIRVHHRMLVPRLAAADAVCGLLLAERRQRCGPHCGPETLYPVISVGRSAHSGTATMGDCGTWPWPPPFHSCRPARVSRCARAGVRSLHPQGNAPCENMCEYVAANQRSPQVPTGSLGWLREWSTVCRYAALS